MGAAKTPLHYARPDSIRAGFQAVPSSLVVHSASLGLGVVLLLYSVSKDWSWDVFFAAPIGFALLVAQCFLAFAGLIPLLSGRALGSSERWLPLLIMAAGPLATVATLWHAVSTASGC